MATQNKLSNSNLRNNSVVIPQGGAPTVKYFAERQIEITNPQLSKQLKHVEYFGLNYSTLIGSFIKASQSISVKLFDEYVEKLLFTTTASIDNELAKYTKLKSNYDSLGYVFKFNSKPLKVKLRIYRSCINNLTDLLLKIDQLITLLNFLEKTPCLNTPELYKKVSELIKIPNLLSRKIFTLTKTLNEKFEFDAKSKNSVLESIDFNQINQLMKNYQTAQLLSLTNNDSQVSIKKSKQKKKLTEPVKSNGSEILDVTPEIETDSKVTVEPVVGARDW